MPGATTKGLLKASRALINNERLYLFAARMFLRLYRVYCLFKYGYADFFWVIAIEISTFCNRSCYYCPNSKHETPKEYMSREVFKKVIQDLREIGYTGAVTYQFFGEPLLDDRLVDFVRYAKEKLPTAMFIKVVSNGDALTMELFEKLIDAGMKEISITLHDLDPARSMERLRPMIEKHPSHIRVTSIHQQGGHLSNRGGAVEIENKIAMKSCPWTSNAIVDTKGNVLLCCSDYFYEYNFGNVMHERIDDIWKQKGFKELRKAARRGKPLAPLCKKCFGVDET